MPNIRTSLVLLAIGGFLASCAVSPVASEPGKVTDTAQISLAPGNYRQLAGWSTDNVAQALPAFAKSCERIVKQQTDGAPLDASATDANFGKLRDWRPLCRQVATLPSGDDGAARQFFEANFVPVLVGSKGTSKGLFTGYWEVELDGSRTQEGPYQFPVYRKPADLTDKPYLDRTAIDDGALAGKDLEVVWLQSADDVFVLQMQGSGRIHLPDGSTVRLVYAANNNRPFVNVSQMLIGMGAIPPAQFSEAAVRAWMRDNPDQAKELRRKDPLYVFFQELKGDGPVGYQGAVLTAERSLAVDHRFIPLGVPLWLDAHDKYRPVAVQRLVVAQDTGDGIVGPLRGDFYWGSGKKAAARGSDFFADGQYWVLLPKTVATQMTAALN
ncbi:MAG TPA: MltA domain-containing protein [Stellaceae bacterium]|jgi:membrane-bound lytic murein transglycosylase A|nr:MltA domain-containing protein [Stellaceae bacterium]